MKNRVGRNLVFLAMVAFLTAPVSALAAPLGFYNITASDPEDAAIGEAQLWVDVTEVGAGQVAFTFNNDGPEACSIARVYFDDGPLLGVAYIIAGPGASFSLGSSPPNLPGWDTIDPVFETSAGFSADSDPPVQPQGVNPGEYLTLVFDLQSGSVFSDVVDALFSGALRIGLHVQGYASEGSESFVNCPPECIDMDGDGYGSPASPACPYPELDCDDSDPNVHPGAEEICNDGIDNNCSGLIDCDDPACFGDPACCPDNDGDGYMDCSCAPPPCDCDDTNPDVHPGAYEGCCVQETCFDGIDNDCNGLIDSEEPACHEWCMTMGASTLGTSTGSGSRYANHLGILLVPLAVILLWKGRRGRR